MTAQEYLATIKRPMTDLEKNFVVEAWEAAKKDSQAESKHIRALKAIAQVEREESDMVYALDKIKDIAEEALKEGKSWPDSKTN